MTTCKIALRDRNGDIVDYTAVSASDFVEVNKYTWFRKQGRNTFYALSRVNGRNISLHRFLLGKPEIGYVVDHRNRNGLDNTRDNLRFLTFSQNSQNVALRGGTSSYRGVSWNQHAKKWDVRVGKQHIGYYEDEDEAAEMADRAAVQIFGIEAALNGQYTDDELSALQPIPDKKLLRDLPTGVTIENNKFLAKISNVRIGLFATSEDAHKAYMEKKSEISAEILAGHFARTITRDVEGVAIIPLHDINGITVQYALVDDDDWHKLTLTSWSLSDGYCVGSVNGKMTAMHAIVCPETEDMSLNLVDHKNKIRHDNRKNNLRWTDASNNSQNRNKLDGCASRFIGVTGRPGYWTAAICKGKKYHLGTFDEEEQAAVAYNQAATELYDLPMLNDIICPFIEMPPNYNLCLEDKPRYNSAKRRNCATSYKWVSKVSAGAWEACIKKNGVRHRSGRLPSQEAAALAANKIAKELFGDNVVLNDINEDDVPPPPESKKKSKFNGVTVDSKSKKWVACICIKKSNRFLGSFNVEEDAARAYNVALRKAVEDGDLTKGYMRRLNDVAESTAPEHMTITTEGSDQRKRGKSSKYKGVSWGASNNTWSVEIQTRDGKRIREHRKDEREAGLRYNELALLHKDNPRLNIIDAV